MPEWQSSSPDIVALIRDDHDRDPQRRFKMVWQTTHPANKPGPEKVRTKCLGYGPDVEHFTASKANPILHPNDGLEQENHFLMFFPYCSQYIMLYEYGWYMPNRTGNFGSYCADIRLAISEDGEHFKRIQPHQKVISRGRHGEWDDGFLVISDKPAIKDDKIYLYYAGNGEDWTSWPRQNTAPGYRFPSSGSVRLSRMGLATIDSGRLACLETSDRETPGSVATRPIEVSARGAQLLVNVSDAQQNRSWIAVAVLDPETGKPLSGFAGEDCQSICRNGAAVPVKWKDKTFADVGASRIRLRFMLNGAARLYSYGFEKL
jgi:hypothetical protein